LLPLVKGVAEAALYCAQEGHLAAPFQSLSPSSPWLQYDTAPLFR